MKNLENTCKDAMNQDFIEETNKWLNPLGYTLHSYSGDRTWLMYTDLNDQDSPCIVCKNDGNEKKCSLTHSGNLKMFIELCTMDFQYKHKDIGRFIKTISHYARICRLHPPF